MTLRFDGTIANGAEVTIRALKLVTCGAPVDTYVEAVDLRGVPTYSADSVRTCVLPAACAARHCFFCAQQTKSELTHSLTCALMRGRRHILGGCVLENGQSSITCPFLFFLSFQDASARTSLVLYAQ